MTPLESELFQLAALVRDWIKSGARTDQILERLAAPESAGRALLDRAQARRDAGEAYLQRDPHMLLIKVEDSVASPKKRKARRG